MKKIISQVLLIISLCSFLTSCKKDKDNPPALPPEESMTIDFSNFEPGKKSAVAYSSKGIENSNWEFAALVAGYFRSVIAGTLAVPVYSFKLASGSAPVFIENKTWEWNYSASLAGITYKARLTGQVRTSDVQWKMYITGEGSGGFPEFLWFEGTSESDGTGGQWILNHSPQFKEPVLQIDWTISGNTAVIVKYTYIRDLDNNRDPDPFKTSNIEYGKQTGSLDSYYSIFYFNGLAFSEMDVEWNSTTHNGRVRCLAFFANSDWHCWNGNLVNVICP